MGNHKSEAEIGVNDAGKRIESQGLAIFGSALDGQLKLSFSDFPMELAGVCERQSDVSLAQRGIQLYGLFRFLGAGGKLLCFLTREVTAGDRVGNGEGGVGLGIGGVEGHGLLEIADGLAHAGLGTLREEE